MRLQQCKNSDEYKKQQKQNKKEKKIYNRLQGK